MTSVATPSRRVLFSDVVENCPDSSPVSPLPPRDEAPQRSILKKTKLVPASTSDPDPSAAPATGFFLSKDCHPDEAISSACAALEKCADGTINLEVYVGLLSQLRNADRPSNTQTLFTSVNRLLILCRRDLVTSETSGNPLDMRVALQIVKIVDYLFYCEQVAAHINADLARWFLGHGIEVLADPSTSKQYLAAYLHLFASQSLPRDTPTALLTVTMQNKLLSIAQAKRPDITSATLASEYLGLYRTLMQLAPASFMIQHTNQWMGDLVACFVDGAAAVSRRAGFMANELALELSGHVAVGSKARAAVDPHIMGIWSRIVQAQDADSADEVRAAFLFWRAILLLLVRWGTQEKRTIEHWKHLDGHLSLCKKALENSSSEVKLAGILGFRAVVYIWGAQPHCKTKVSPLDSPLYRPLLTAPFKLLVKTQPLLVIEAVLDLLRRLVIAYSAVFNSPAHEQALWTHVLSPTLTQAAHMNVNLMRLLPPLVTASKASISSQIMASHNLDPVMILASEKLVLPSFSAKGLRASAGPILTLISACMESDLDTDDRWDANVHMYSGMLHIVTLLAQREIRTSPETTAALAAVCSFLASFWSRTRDCERMHSLLERTQPVGALLVNICIAVQDGDLVAIKPDLTASRLGDHVLSPDHCFVYLWEQLCKTAAGDLRQSTLDPEQKHFELLNRFTTLASDCLHNSPLVSQFVAQAIKALTQDLAPRLIVMLGSRLLQADNNNKTKRVLQSMATSDLEEILTQVAQTRPVGYTEVSSVANLWIDIISAGLDTGALNSQNVDGLVESLAKYGHCKVVASTFGFLKSGQVPVEEEVGTSLFIQSWQEFVKEFSDSHDRAFQAQLLCRVLQDHFPVSIGLQRRLLQLGLDSWTLFNSIKDDLRDTENSSPIRSLADLLATRIRNLRDKALQSELTDLLVPGMQSQDCNQVSVSINLWNAVYAEAGLDVYSDSVVESVYKAKAAHGLDVSLPHNFPPPPEGFVVAVLGSTVLDSTCPKPLSSPIALANSARGLLSPNTPKKVRVLKGRKRKAGVKRGSDEPEMVLESSPCPELVGSNDLDMSDALPDSAEPTPDLSESEAAENKEPTKTKNSAKRCRKRAIKAERLAVEKRAAAARAAKLAQKVADDLVAEKPVAEQGGVEMVAKDIAAALEEPDLSQGTQSTPKENSHLEKDEKLSSSEPHTGVMESAELTHRSHPFESTHSAQGGTSAMSVGITSVTCMSTASPVPPPIMSMSMPLPMSLPMKSFEGHMMTDLPTHFYQQQYPGQPPPPAIVEHLRSQLPEGFAILPVPASATGIPTTSSIPLIPSGSIQHSSNGMEAGVLVPAQGSGNLVMEPTRTDLPPACRGEQELTKNQKKRNQQEDKLSQSRKRPKRLDCQSSDLEAEAEQLVTEQTPTHDTLVGILKTLNSVDDGTLAGLNCGQQDELNMLLVETLWRVQQLKRV